MNNLSKKQSSQLESIQKRAIRIIYRVTQHVLYKTDVPNKQKVSLHQFWINLHAYIISSRSNVTTLLLPGCVRRSNSQCHWPKQIHFNRL